MTSTLASLLPKTVPEWSRLVQKSLSAPIQTVWYPEHFYLTTAATAGRAKTAFSPQKVPSAPAAAAAAASAAKSSAVLVLLAPAPTAAADGFQDMSILLTKRAMSLRTHKGQISFPGGHVDPGETPAMAAQRETEEEVAVPRGEYQVLGELTSFNHIAGGHVTPVVAIASSALAPRCASPREVDSLHYVHLSNLVLRGADSHARLMKYHSFTRNMPCHFPCVFASDAADVVCPPIRSSASVQPVTDDAGFAPMLPEDYPGSVVWGLTSFVLCELVARLAAVIEAQNPGVECATAEHILQGSNVIARDWENPKP